jgi:hypothetical protein
VLATEEVNLASEAGALSLPARLWAWNDGLKASVD